MIEIDRDMKRVLCAASGTASRTFSKPQWSTLECLLENQHRIVSLDELATAIYTEQAILYDGVSDEAIKGMIRRVRERIATVSPDYSYIIGYHGWGYKFQIDGVTKSAPRTDSAPPPTPTTASTT